MSQPYDVPLPFDDDPFVSDSLLRYNDISAEEYWFRYDGIHDYVWEEEDE